MDSHHGKTVHHCYDCNSVFSSKANYRRHVAIVHYTQCIYCRDGDEEEDAGGHGRGFQQGMPKFPTIAQLQQHVATIHNQHTDRPPV